jgi:hypothetical protein
MVAGNEFEPPTVRFCLFFSAFFTTPRFSVRYATRYAQKKRRPKPTLIYCSDWVIVVAGAGFVEDYTISRHV